MPVIWTPKRYIIGVDEVGYGAWAGPLVVVAAAFFSDLSWPKELGGSTVLDSKALKTHARRVAAASVIEHLCIYKHILELDAQHLDNLGAVKALCGAIKVAAYSCMRALNDGVLVAVDGNPLKGSDMSFTYIVRGDTKVHAIAAASILAKVHRDNLMVELAGSYPVYGLERNKGYGTETHRQALVKHGPCSIHRRSYSPIREMLDEHKGGEVSCTPGGSPDLVQQTD